MATVLITAGPTREHLDEVRFLSNASTGRMGYALARAAVAAGHRTVLVSGPTELDDPDGAEVYHVISALEMHAAVRRRFKAADIVFGAAAVSDLRFAVRRRGKPPKPDHAMAVGLVPNPDIIAAVAYAGGARVVIGFALEAVGRSGSKAMIARARAKLDRKGLDAIAVNTAAALGAEHSEVTLLCADGSEQRFPSQSKDVTAARLVEAALELW